MVSFLGRCGEKEVVLPLEWRLAVAASVLVMEEVVVRM